jgi:hypothetical protein
MPGPIRTLCQHTGAVRTIPYNSSGTSRAAKKDKAPPKRGLVLLTGLACYFPAMATRSCSSKAFRFAILCVLAAPQLGCLGQCCVFRNQQLVKVFSQKDRVQPHARGNL